MKTYKAIIELKGKLVTPLMGDTIFGHIIWGIARHNDADFVSDFISNIEENPLVVSNAFPSGYLPKPILSNIRDMDYLQQKKLKKIKYIPEEIFFGNKKISSSSILEHSEKKKQYKMHITGRLRNTCHRLTGGTIENQGLYEIEEIWYEPSNTTEKTPFDIYICTDLEQDTLKQYLDWAFECGYGADSSTGAGNIYVKEIIPIEFPKEGNRAMALGPFVIDDNQYSQLDLLSNTILKRGKLGDYFGQITNPFKKPIIFYTEGSSFSCDNNNCVYIGKLIKNIHTDNRIVHQGWAPVIRFNEEEYEKI
ncbi:hypothetical protein WKV44_00475 [Spirochaetia bacterium 38H-sp]|uniref:CRISPR system Cms protein Csm4 n=1 Tax=Rarispira pelagica TaxID=3141764 RepID=A0ABU9UA21_9SPIR